jgi:NADPH-dependent glutamate synthase beta subunit-like oxidoreductase
MVQPSHQRAVPQKIAIIGGGPAGLSCAYYLAEKGYKPVVFEKKRTPGGMLMNGIPSLPLEKDVVEAEIDVCAEMGVEFRCGVEVGKDVTIPQLREQGYKASMWPSAAGRPEDRHAPGEDAEGVEGGLDFLRKVNRARPRSAAGQGPWSSAAATSPSTWPAPRCAAAQTAWRCTAWNPTAKCPAARTTRARC